MVAAVAAAMYLFISHFLLPGSRGHATGLSLSRPGLLYQLFG
jgi:hypothetical protein